MTDDEETKRLDAGKKRLEWHVAVSSAVRAAIEPLAGDKAPPGESIEITVRVTTTGSEMWASYFLDGTPVDNFFTGRRSCPESSDTIRALFAPEYVRTDKTR